MYVAMGSPATLKVYLDITRNEWAYGGLNGVTTSPSTHATNLAALRTETLALIPQATFVINTTISQVSEGAVAGSTLAQFRTAVEGLSGFTIINGPGLGITQPTYLGDDGVHVKQAGASRIVLGPNGTDGVAQALGLA
jgi:hypothetical protein